jgi:hypothetical protein
MLNIAIEYPYVFFWLTTSSVILRETNAASFIFQFWRLSFNLTPIRVRVWFPNGFGVNMGGCN